MSGLKLKRLIWSIAFLGVTLAAIVMECIAGLWHPTGWTIPWTEYLARYVPWPIQLIAYVALATWLPFHFWRHDHMRKIAYKRGFQEGHYEGHAEGFKAGQRLTAYKPGGPVTPLTGLLRKTGAIGPDQHARVDPNRGDVHY